MSIKTAIGIDGCRSGWIVASVDESGAPKLDLFQTLSSIAVEYHSYIWFIDIPLHLVSSGYRQCDIEARRLLGINRSSVFYTPVRGVFDYAVEKTIGSQDEKYRETNSFATKAGHKRLSKQSFSILGKIKEALDFFQVNTSIEAEEYHPELCYRIIAHKILKIDQKLQPKKEKGGYFQRLELVNQLMPTITGEVISNHRMQRNWILKQVGRDDIADALIAPVLYNVCGGKYHRIGDSQEKSIVVFDT